MENKYDQLGINFESEDSGTREDPMDEGYTQMHSGIRVVFCVQCSEACEVQIDNGLCDSCIDKNFRKEIKDIIHYENEKKYSLVHRYNCIAMKYYNNYDYFKWCPKCEKPKSWFDSKRAIDYDANDETKMHWDYEYEDVIFCFECHVRGDDIEVETYE